MTDSQATYSATKCQGLIEALLHKCKFPNTNIADIPTSVVVYNNWKDIATHCKTVIPEPQEIQKVFDETEAKVKTDFIQPSVRKIATKSLIDLMYDVESTLATILESHGERMVGALIKNVNSPTSSSSSSLRVAFFPSTWWPGTPTIKSPDQWSLLPNDGLAQTIHESHKVCFKLKGFSLHSEVMELRLNKLLDEDVQEKTTSLCFFNIKFVT
jgi:hypothetical protein